MIDYTSQPKDNNFSINKHSLQAVFGIPGVVFYDSVISDNLILLSARLKGQTAKCTCCSKRSKSVHSSYTRKLTDLSVTGRAVKIILKVRKFRCRNSRCSQTVFSEQHLPLNQKYSRLTDRTSHYLQRRNLVEYAREHGEDLFKKCQAQITRDQILEFHVSGKQVRMDSKLIGSNIAWYSRYELIHETLRLFIAEREDHIFKKSLPKEVFSLIESIQGEKGNKVVYRSTKAEIDTRLVELGELMYRFIGLFKRYDYGHYRTLKTVFGQQYRVSGDKTVLPLDNKEISAKSIQSPHDTDCHYRDKDGNRVKGYSVNITETCDRVQQGEAPVVNLITDTQVDVVSAPDNSFLGQALEHTQKIIPDKIEKVYADGAYHSGHNQEYCQEGDKGIDLVLTAMQGAEPRYGLSLDEQDENNLIVTDKKTGKTVQARQVKTRKNKTGEDKTVKKWAIKTGENKYRYFDEDSLRVSALRQKLRKIPIEETNIRNNVEASIFQLGYHYPNDKSRYRRLAKHKLWAYSRSLWVNFIRIVKYITQICQRPLFGQKSPQYIANL